MRIPIIGVGVIAILLASAGINDAASETKQSSRLLELVYSMKELGDNSAPAYEISPKGDMIAYLVKETPPEFDWARSTESRFTPSGTPNGVIGMRIRIASITGQNDVLLCGDKAGDANSWRPIWSPDGAQLAFYSDVDGYPQVWIYDVAENACRKVSDRPIRVRHWAGDGVQWARDARMIYVPLQPAALKANSDSETALAPADPGKVASVKLYYGGGEAPPGVAAENNGEPMEDYFLFEHNADIAAIDVLTGAVRIIVDATGNPRPSVARISPSGRWLSYLSVFYGDSPGQAAFQDLAFAPSGGGESKVLAEKLQVPNRPSQYFTYTYRWHPAKDRLVYLKAGALWTVDFDANGPGAERQLEPGLGRFVEDVLTFTPDGEQILVGLSPADRNSRQTRRGRPQSLVLVPLEGGKAIQIPLNGDFIFDSALKDSAGRLWLSRAGEFFVYARHKKTGDCAILEVSTKTGAQKVVWRASAELSHVSVSPKGEIFAVYEDFKTAPDIYRLSSHAAKKLQITRNNQELSEFDPGTVHIFETVIPLFDSTMKKVRTAVLLPPGVKPGDRPPAIAYIYPEVDYPAGATKYGFTGSPFPPGIFTSQGYAVIYPFVDIGPGGEPGDAIQEITDALLPQVYKAAELGLVDIERLALTGASFGGFATVAVASQTNLFQAAIPINGPYDLAGNYGHFRKGPSGDAAMAQWTEHVQPRIGNHPWADRWRVLTNSPYYKASTINTPILILQGEDDAFLPEAQKLFVALRRLDKPVQLAIYGGSGHVPASWPLGNAVDASERVLNFLHRHIDAKQSLGPVDKVFHSQAQ